MKKKKRDKISMFIGTRITKHDVTEAEEALKSQGKDYDEYDLYVCYKRMLEKEKQNSEKYEVECDETGTKRRRIRINRGSSKIIASEENDKEKGFRPCQYISSIYKKYPITNKSVMDYIDKNDSIYEDVIVNPIYQKAEKYANNIYISFANCHVSFKLLRNSGYVEGLPLGINLSRLNILNNSCVEKYNEDSYMLEKVKKDKKKNKKRDEKEKEKGEEEEEMKTTETVSYKNKKENTLRKDKTKEERHIIGPQLPDLYEKIRQKYKAKINNDKHSTSKKKNYYIQILAQENKQILEKIKDAEQYEKRLAEFYKPKQNFEGAYFVNTTEKNQEKSTLSVFSPEKNISYDEYNDEETTKTEYRTKSPISSYENSSSDETKQTILQKCPTGNLFNRKRRLSDDSNEYASSHSQERKKPRQCDQVVTRDDSNNKSSDNFFLLGNVTVKEKIKEREMYTSFYNSLKRNVHIKTHTSERWDHENYLLYYQYSKLIKGNVISDDAVEKLLSLYAPPKKWVTFNDDEKKNIANEISDLKRKIRFNNNLKKKNRFVYFCKAKDKNIEIKYIFSKNEYSEFNDLMKKLKKYENLYREEIIEDGINTNYHIHDYHFNDEVLKKLHIIVNGESDAEEENNDIQVMTYPLPYVPASFCSLIFNS